MPCRARVAWGRLVCYALNGVVARLPLFQDDGDYEASEAVMAVTIERPPPHLLAYCLTSNHWRSVFWSREDGELTACDPAQCLRKLHWRSPIFICGSGSTAHERLVGNVDQPPAAGGRAPMFVVGNPRRSRAA